MNRYFPIEPPDTQTSAMRVGCPECNSHVIDFERLEFGPVQDLVLRFRCDQGHTFEFRFTGGAGTDMCLYPLNRKEGT